LQVDARAVDLGELARTELTSVIDVEGLKGQRCLGQQQGLAAEARYEIASLLDAKRLAFDALNVWRQREGLPPADPAIFGFVDQAAVAAAAAAAKSRAESEETVAHWPSLGLAGAAALQPAHAAAAAAPTVAVADGDGEDTTVASEAEEVVADAKAEVSFASEPPPAHVQQEAHAVTQGSPPLRQQRSPCAEGWTGEAIQGAGIRQTALPAPATPPTSASTTLPSNLFYLYQSSDGQLCFLHPMNMKMLLRQYRVSQLLVQGKETHSILVAVLVQSKEREPPP
jgi:hypothetical protein